MLSDFLSRQSPYKYCNDKKKKSGQYWNSSYSCVHLNGNSAQWILRTKFHKKKKKKGSYFGV